MLRRFGSHVRNQWIGTVALFLVLSGGTAMAVDGSLPGQNTVGSEDIINNDILSKDIANGRIFNVDLADNLITGEKMKDDTLTGADVNEATLAQVPSALDADKLGGVNAASFAQKGSENWHPATFQPPGAQCSWSNFGQGFSTAGYLRDQHGFVHLKGLVQFVGGGVPGACSFNSGYRFVFALPAGYRPGEDAVFPTLANNKPARINVLSFDEPFLEGFVAVEPGFPTEADAAQWVSLEGITFRCTPSGQDGCP